MLRRFSPLWGKPRATVIGTEVADIIARYDTWERRQRHECLAAFDNAKADIEIDHGPIEDWPAEWLNDFAWRLEKAAQQEAQISPQVASGTVMLSRLIELHHFSGPLAKETIALIGIWHDAGVRDALPPANGTEGHGGKPEKPAFPATSTAATRSS